MLRCFCLNRLYFPVVTVSPPKIDFLLFFWRFAQVNFRNFLHNKHYIHDCFFLHLYNDLDIFVATAARMYISFFCSHIPKVNTHVPCSAVCIHFCHLFCCCLKVYNLKTIVYVMLWLFEIYDIYRIKLHVRLVFGCLEKKNSFTEGSSFWSRESFT